MAERRGIIGRHPLAAGYIGGCVFRFGGNPAQVTAEILLVLFACVVQEARERGWLSDG